MKSINYLCFLILVFCFAFNNAIAADEQIQLKDLGFSSEATKPDEARQALLDTRTHKLKTHEVLGPITWALMTATVLTANEGRVTTAHKVLGLTTAASYFTAAYFSLTAPEDPQAGEEKTNLKIHKALAWVHFPLMIATPIVGLIAQKQLNKGERLHGIADHKGDLGTATYVAFSAAFAVMIFDF
ncbi:MAG: hypothetical protein ACXWQO_04350 [Bdellovibrionota bacterium]